MAKITPMPRSVHAELPADSEAQNSQTGAGAQYHLVRNVAGTVTIIVAGIITITENITEANEKDRITGHCRYVDRSELAYRDMRLTRLARSFEAPEQDVVIT